MAPIGPLKPLQVPRSRTKPPETGTKRRSAPLARENRSVPGFANYASPNGLGVSGSSYVVFGRSAGFNTPVALSNLNGSNGFRLDGAAAGDLAGNAVSAAGDINGDGIGDLIVAAFEADPNGQSAAGSSYVVFGRDGRFGSPISLGSINGSNGFRLDGATAADRSGGSVSAAGDINGDGVDDVIIGASYADPSGPNSGSSYVVFGTRNGVFSDGFESPARAAPNANADVR